MSPCKFHNDDNDDDDDVAVVKEARVVAVIRVGGHRHVVNVIL